MTEPLTFDAFLETAPGALLLEWERAQYSELTADVFGYAALQIGSSRIDTLAENRICAHWLLTERPADCLGVKEERRIVLGEPEALPFADESMDLVTLVHALELSESPQQVLREAVRVLEPEGRLVLTAFNGLGLWWLRHRLVALGARPYLPSRMLPISLGRIQDWLALLGLEIDRGRFGLYAPGFRSRDRLRRWTWLDKAGDRWAPHFSNLILLSAVKRRPGTRLIRCGHAASRSESDRRAEIPVASSNSGRTTSPSPLFQDTHSSVERPS